MSTTKTAKRKSRLILGDFLKITPIFHERNFVFDKKLVFVLMPFSETWSDRVWEKLNQIITSKGLRAERADNRFGAIITEDIWMGIMEARLIICDTTGWNPNVFYELGIAHTLGKHVILLTQPTHHLPFDTQGLRHFIYTDNPDGMRKLESELPQWIDYCLTLKSSIERVTDRKESLTTERISKKGKGKPKKPGKAKIKEAWLLNSNGYDPELPPIKYGAFRSRFGTVKIRMMQYAFALSEERISQFVEDVRKIWPEKWDNFSEDEISKKYEETEELVNSLRSDYRKAVE